MYSYLFRAHYLFVLNKVFGYIPNLFLCLWGLQWAKQH